MGLISGNPANREPILYCLDKRRRFYSFRPVGSLEIPGATHERVAPDDMHRIPDLLSHIHRCNNPVTGYS